MITLSGLTKRFGPLTAVDDVSLTVGNGEVLGFLGPNGAGKSTAMRMLTGFLAPSAGTATVCGHDVVDDALAARKRIGYLPEGAPLYGDMTPASFLDFIARVRGYSGIEKRQRIDMAAGRLQLGNVLHQPIDTLSKGYKRRVGLAQAILHDPDVLVLDEPTDGLDPNQKQQVRALIRDMRHGKAIVISTHILEEVEAVCTRAVIIARGRLVFDGTPEELQRRSDRHNAVAIRLGVDAADAARSEIETVAGVARVEVGESANGTITLLAVAKDGGPIIQDVSRAVRAKNIAVDEIHAERGRLDEVFRDLTIGH
jgi:ABC-2 type transport system ATP-binding protein